MIKIEVTRPVCIPSDDLESKRDLKKGIYEVSEAVLEHWFVSALMRDGAICKVSKSKPKIAVKPVQVKPEKQTIVVSGPDVPKSMQDLVESVENEEISVDDDKSTEVEIISPTTVKRRKRL